MGSDGGIGLRDRHGEKQAEKCPDAATYRTPMMVTDLLVYRRAFHTTGYYVCPRCGITMEREFMAYCDRCGQCLNWKNYKKAKIRCPENSHK